MNLCECGCRQVVRNRFVRGHNKGNLGNKHSDKTKELLSSVKKEYYKNNPQAKELLGTYARKFFSNSTNRKKHRQAIVDVVGTLEMRKQNSEMNRELWKVPGYRDKMRNKSKEFWSNLDNRKNQSIKKIIYFSNPENRKKHSKIKKESFSNPENLQKYRDKMADYYSYVENRIKVSCTLQGISREEWTGFIAQEPYCDIWVAEYKEFIRYRDNYCCQNLDDCRKINEKDLCIHHIDYDKKNCDLKNLTTLCRSCHSRTNYNRTYWKEYYTNLLGD